MKIDDQLAPAVLAQILEGGRVGLVALSPDETVLSWTAGMQRILGWSAEEVLGRALPTPLEAQTLARSKDGATTAVEVTVLTPPEPGQKLLLVTDAPARARDRELFRFRELLDAAPDAILEIDSKGRIILVNDAAEQLFGYTRQELLHQPVDVLVPDAVRGGHQEHRRRYAEHPTRRPMGSGLRLHGKRKDGSEFPVEISLSPVYCEDQFCVAAIIRDVSERHQSEERLRAMERAYTEELAEKNRELQSRNAEVEKANRMKSEFLSGVSHELRTPLHTVIGFTELLLEEFEGPLTDKQKRFTKHIHRDAQHLLALINDVLDLSKIESGRLELQSEVFPVAHTIDEVVSSLNAKAALKGLQIEVDLADDAMELFADRLRFKQILYNLLSNAVKFTAASGRVWLEAEPRGVGGVLIRVNDTGIGIAQTQHEAIFDKFYQIGQKQASGAEGTGLGLAITRHLVEMHGGQIRVDSEPGKGSRFTFTMPGSASAVAN
ncbi:hypothetical protein F183_A10470 [Bryobacterales bacterium F-183]|nr:hypothetical protein F183_A10470 [Bryobacterales bacterium F-183]